MQRSIRAVLMRGGSSKGLYLRDTDLPPPGPQRDAAILKLYGSPDARQIDGLGGADVLTSKVAIVGERPAVSGADVDYTFGQVDILNRRVDYGGNCGNISAGVGPFAVDEELFAVSPSVIGRDDAATVRIHNTNTGAVLRATFPVRRIAADDGGSRVVARVDGDCEIAGVPGTGAPIRLDFSDTQGKVTGSLLPSGHRREMLGVVSPDDGVSKRIDATLLDAGQPTVFVTCETFGLCPRASPAEWATQLRRTDLGHGSFVERVRGAAAVKMGMVNEWEAAVRDSPYAPFVVAVAAPAPRGGDAENESDVRAICVFMQQVHKAFPVTGSVATTTAALLSGTLVHECAAVVDGGAGQSRILRICHPSGVMEVEGAVGTDSLSSAPHLSKAVIKRTARRLMDGKAYIPWSVWPQEE